MDNIFHIKKRIKSIISKSTIPEDPIHSKNTLEWLLKLKPDADEALQIAALGHDIERAVVSRKVKRKDYKDFNVFKQTHANNSARILKEIMTECHANESLIKDVMDLVIHHETGGNIRADLIKDADSISFFDVNLSLYYARHSYEETKQRCQWGYKRLSDSMKKHLARFKYKNKELQEMINYQAGRQGL